MLVVLTDRNQYIELKTFGPVCPPTEAFSTASFELLKKKNNMYIRIVVFLLFALNFLSANTKREFVNSIVGGVNYTFFNDYETSPRFNYSFGVLITSKYTEKVSLYYLMLYSKTSSFIKTLSDKSFSPSDLKSYKNYYDLEFKESFFNFNILGNYQIYQDRNFNINCGLGLGF